MQLSTKTEEQLRIVSVREERIDAAVALEFKDAMRVQTEDGPHTVVLDLSEVQFIDSSGLGAIVASMKTLGAERKMALAGLTPTVERVFQLTRMDSVFSVFSTVDGALAELR
ncbi:STAS domain-containing protein [uncultured Roseobacter sp.]|uniref:STAS domain-containing protein n=1 Tax=uncultured Roseobacter sp. TaxID=114847 RepID=UPI002608A71C|nr:STAS domain-containing protein [uncultured Roseobacter sp.]